MSEVVIFWDTLLNDSILTKSKIVVEISNAIEVTAAFLIITSSNHASDISIVKVWAKPITYVNHECNVST